MSLPQSYWVDLANDYVTAFQQVFGTLPTKNAVLLAAAVAEHETNNGRAWPGTYNFGAVQLRTLTVQEYTAFTSGSLKAGDKFPGNPGGVLHVDTHPTPSGPQPYPVWFAAFDTQVEGIAFFLKTLGRLSNKEFMHEGATAFSLCQAMYMGCYFEGAHSGARPCGHRSLPLTAPEAANVTDYAGAVTKILSTVLSVQLASWDVGSTNATPSVPPSPEPSVVTLPETDYDLSTVKGIQAALTYLSVRTHHPEFDPKGTDGIDGPDTESAVRNFQSYAGLSIDGVVGPETRDAIQKAVDMVSPSAPPTDPVPSK